MSTHPRVTCVIPVFNGERYLPAAIESVLNQSTGAPEIIVVDDGSTDSTARVARQFAAQVRYLCQSNSGPASARNHGVEAASGEFIAFLDADDLWTERKTEIQLARFAANPDLAVCMAHMQNFLSEDANPSVTSLGDQHLEQSQPGIASTFVARKSLFDAVGPLNAKYKHRDIQDLMVRALDRGLAVETVPDILVRRRIHAHNMSRNRSGADQLELFEITRARLARRRVAGA